MMKYFKLIRRNLFRNRLRMLLTLALLATIFFFVTVLMGILHSFTSLPAEDEASNRVVVQSAISIVNRIPFRYEQKLRQLPGVVDVCKQQWVGSYYKDMKTLFTNYAVDHDHFATVFDDYKVDPKQFAEWKADRRGALVGRELMERFQWKVGQRITLTHNIYPNDLELTIRGIVDHPVNRSSLYLHMDYYATGTTPNVTRVGTFWLKVKDARNMAPLSQQIDSMFRNSEYPTETFTEKEFQASMVSWMGNVRLLFTAISAAAIAMVVMLAAITMSMAARERVTEIAVLKAIGYGKPLVMAIMLAEFMLLTLLGGLAGILAAKGIFSFADMARLTSGSVKGFAITGELIATCTLLAAAVGLIAGGLPALRASNLSVVDGLRRVV